MRLPRRESKMRVVVAGVLGSVEFGRKRIFSRQAVRSQGKMVYIQSNRSPEKRPGEL